MLKGTKLCLLLVGQVIFYVVAIFILNEPVRNKIKGIIVGGTSGHISTICSEKSDQAKKFSSVDFAKSTPSINDYYFFDIQNPREYLQGENAEIVEKGPYMLKQYQVNFDIGFKQSSLTASTSPNPNGTIEYKVANAYVVLDADAELVSRLNTSTSSTKNLKPQRKIMPSSLSMSDKITSLSPAYLSLLKGATSELTLILSLMCSSKQIANIAIAGPGGATQCEATQRLDPVENDCACCMLSDTHDIVAQLAPGIIYLKCNEFLQETDPVMSTLSLLASYDGGIAVKSAGDPTFDGSGAAFETTLFGQDKFYTPLIQTHSVNDIMFGYPSALLGSLLAWWTVGPTYLTMVALDSTLTKTSVAKLFLAGKLDNALPIQVGNMAKYTSDVGSVCSSTCSAVASDNPLFHSPLGWMCKGNAPKRTETSNIDAIALGGIDCRPYSSTFSSKMYCQQISEKLASRPGEPGYEECECADSALNNDWSGSGCCLAGGMFQGKDLAGVGCLFSIPGAVDTNWLGQDDKSSTELDLGKAVEEYISRKDLKPQSVFVCPAPGIGQAEHQKFDYFESYDGQSQFVTFYDTGLPRVQIGDELNKSAIPYTSHVTGGTGHYMPPAGLHTHAGGPVLSIGNPSQMTRNIYIGPAKRPFIFEWQRAGGIFPKSCGTTHCLPTVRMLQSDKNFMQLDATQKQTGQGLPFEGLVSLGYLSGIPVYLHQPFFMGGDKELYAQLNNSYVQADPGNGINAYHRSGDYYLYTDSPAHVEFVVGGNNSNYQLVDKAWVEQHRTSFETYLDLEGATGITLESRIRYGVSYSIWECNPELNPACLLALQSKSQARCYKDFGRKFLSSLLPVAKEFLEVQGQDEFTFPCSAANVFTPNVVGGKVLPVYWFSLSTTARPEDVDQLIGLGYTLAKWHHAYFTLLFVAFILTHQFVSVWSTNPNASAKTGPVS